MKPAPRNGLSLPWGGCPFGGPPLQLRRSWPASSAPRRPSLEPVRFRLPPSPPFDGCGEDHRLPPVARAICPALPIGSLTLLRFGTFRSLRLDARQSSPLGKLVSTKRPISAHSPSTEAFIPAVAGSPLTVRFVRVTRCSANLLEPPSSCLESRVQSNTKQRRRVRFPEKISHTES